MVSVRVKSTDRSKSGCAHLPGAPGAGEAGRVQLQPGSRSRKVLERCGWSRGEEAAHWGRECPPRPRLEGYRPLVAPAGTVPRQATVSTAVFVTPVSRRSQGEPPGRRRLP